MTQITYIDMCREATEIQDMWIPTAGDVVKPDNFSIAKVISDIDSDGMFSFGHLGNNRRDGCIWLPGHDQLRDMFSELFLSSKRWMCFDVLFHIIVETQYRKEYYNLFASLEQFILAYVMESKYSKVWRDESWRDIYLQED